MNSTVGRYKLSSPSSALNYGAIPVPCYDRHLCYCRRPPPPPPSRYRVTVNNCLTNAPIVGAQVALNSNYSALTVSGGVAEFFPIQPGSYSGSASATGFVSKNLNVTNISVNDTQAQTICLDPNPCTLRVITVLDSSSAALPGVGITLGGGFGNGTTALSGADAVATFSLRADRASTVAGLIVGYFPESIFQL